MIICACGEDGNAVLKRMLDSESYSSRKMDADQRLGGMIGTERTSKLFV